MNDKQTIDSIKNNIDFERIPEIITNFLSKGASQGAKELFHLYELNGFECDFKIRNPNQYECTFMSSEKGQWIVTLGEGDERVTFSAEAIRYTFSFTGMATYGTVDNFGASWGFYFEVDGQAINSENLKILRKLVGSPSLLDTSYHNGFSLAVVGAETQSLSPIIASKKNPFFLSYEYILASERI